jgi:hypothetical protein
MRLARSTNRRRITRIAIRGSIAAELQLDRKPDRYRDHRQNNYTPHHGGDLFRAPASRRVIGGVVEFLLHAARLPAKPRWCKIMPNANLSKHRHELVPQRCTFPVAIMFRRCRLRGADRIGRRKTTHQTGLELRMGFPIGQSGFAGVGGMLVVWRRIEFLSHVGLHSQDNALAVRTFPTSESGRH